MGKIEKTFNTGDILEASDMNEIVSAVNSAPDTENNDNADLDICDEDGYILARFSNGHIKTRNFNSSTLIDDAKIKISSKSW